MDIQDFFGCFLWHKNLMLLIVFKILSHLCTTNSQTVLRKFKLMVAMNLLIKSLLNFLKLVEIFINYYALGHINKMALRNAFIDLLS